MHCPLQDIELKVDRCPLDSCSYCQNGKCVENTVRSIGNFSDEHRLESSAIVFGVTIQQVQAAVRNIAIAENARRFFVYLTGKQSIREITPRDVSLVRESEEAYAAWNQYRGYTKPKFGKVIQVLEMVELNVQGEFHGTVPSAK